MRAVQSQLTFVGADEGEPVPERYRSAWDCFQAWDVRLLGEQILDPVEQARWARAVFLGGLPYMWRKASVIRELVYDRLELRRGDRVLLLGESLEPCGFVQDVRARVGPQGEIGVVEILEEARQAYLTRRTGSGGQIATWRFAYTRNVPDGYFDCVAVLQGVQHADDWRAVGGELLRVMRSGRRIVLAEITFGPGFRRALQADLHVEYLFEKLFERMGWKVDEFPYYSPEDLLAAFDGLVEAPETFAWKNVELFWGRKA